MRPLVADLYCGAGGAAMGLYRAGFLPVGFDIVPQPRYPFDFVLQDALTVKLDAFDAVWASPPCQRYTNMLARWGSPERRAAHPDLVAPTRELLEESGLPFIIENVRGAPLNGMMLLCGTAFGLGVRDRTLIRHRYFETNWPVMAPSCQHNRRKSAIPVYGHAGGSSARDQWRNGSTADWKVAMGIDWMVGKELAEAVPPAYSEYLGHALRAHMAATAPAAGLAGAQATRTPRRGANGGSGGVA